MFTSYHLQVIMLYTMSLCFHYCSLLYMSSVLNMSTKFMCPRNYHSSIYLSCEHISYASYELQYKYCMHKRKPTILSIQEYLTLLKYLMFTTKATRMCVRGNDPSWQEENNESYAWKAKKRYF